MKSFMKKFSAKYADAKSRTILIFVGALLIIGILVAVSNMGDEATLDEAVGSSNVAQLGREVTSTPGVGDASEEYNRLRYQKNQQDAETAARAGISAVPTIVSDQVLEETSSQDLIRREQDRLAKEREDAYQRLLAQRRQQEQSALSQQQQTRQKDELKARQQGFENLMAQQAQAFMTEWAVNPRQQYVAGTEPVEALNNNAAATTTTASSSAASNIIYKAGDIVFAVLETSINSDEQGPIMAKIVQGPLKGAKIIGTYQTAGIHAKKLSLVFNVMNVPSLPTSISFNAVAIDPEVGRTALATHVDNHYLLRYGSLFGSAFLEGMSDAVLSSLNSNGVIFEGSSNNLSSAGLRSTEREQIISGLGNVGKKIAENTDFFDRPATITISAGTGFGLLMLADLNLNSEPAAGLQLPAAPTANTQTSSTNTTTSTAASQTDALSAAIIDAINLTAPTQGQP